MDADEARAHSLKAFSESVESHLADIYTEIGQNQDQASREVEYMVVNGHRDYADLDTHYPGWPDGRDDFSYDMLWDVSGEEDLKNERIYLIVDIALRLRIKGYETDFCDYDCCGMDSNDSHIIVNW